MENRQRKIVIPGGTGYMGRALTGRLIERGDEVVILSRGTSTTVPGATVVDWDGARLGAWVDHLDGADAVVHLTGKRVDCRPTRRNIEELIRSRVEPVRLVGEAIRQVSAPPGVWVQSATLAIHGEGGDRMITESTPVSGVGPQQMVQVALAWEAAYREAVELVDRAVLLRIGVAIGGSGDPATERLRTLVRLGLGGTVASGRQWLSWIALDDLLRGLLRAIDEPSMNGMYLLTSPSPVTNAELMATLRRLIGRRMGLSSPAWLTRLGAPMLGSDPELALTGRRAYPERLLAEGFTFGVTDLDEALRRALADA
ncbi:epimerase [Phytoactinopolyspora halotolerans]|uniref:DUF1731 domain-containing protein n=1 Tax=Phytoactinopolyspora halotolerans TaxID=1981512 RepID=A0A6L9S597_9ACTN|nr:DUF1731 domain-containing protein [Phytoactinopolyspora halotolerans]NEE00635.1 DUF1731 domain-containing protein [Phytoactinopolyspora halotolerans]